MADPTVALASLTVADGGKIPGNHVSDSPYPNHSSGNETQTDRAAGEATNSHAAEEQREGVPAKSCEDVAPAETFFEGVWSSVLNNSTITDVAGALAAMHTAAALVDDDKLLEAARLAEKYAIVPPVSNCAFYRQKANPSAEDTKAASTLDTNLPAAYRMFTFLDSLKSNPHDENDESPDDDNSDSITKKQSDNSELTPWLVQGEHMGKRDVSVYYWTDRETGSKLTARIESPITQDMLVPLLSVLNESELYSSWLPNWTVPRFRVRKSIKLTQRGRVSQVIVVTVDLPWPFSSREAVLDACGVDDIDENGDICVLVRALDEFNPSDESLSSSESIKKSLKIEIPSVEEADVVRIGFQGGFLFRALPEDWDDEKPKAKAKASEAQESQKEETTMSYTSWLTSGWGASAKDDTVPPNVDDQFKSPPVQGTNDDVDSEGDAFEDCEDGEDEEENDSTQKGKKILVSVQMFIDPKIDFVPSALMNFVTRTVLYTMWCMLLRVAEQVRDGKRPEHSSLIEKKKHSLYDWTRARCEDMFERVFSLGERETEVLQ